MCVKTVAVACLKLKKIQDFYQKRCEKSFRNVPLRKKNKVSFITQHICLSAFCNTPSLNSSSREGSVNIVELNVNFSGFTVFLTASTTSQTTPNLIKVSSLFLFRVPVCMHECVRLRENERWIEREKDLSCLNPA